MARRIKLSAASGRGHVTWTQAGLVQRALRGEGDAVVHLHGHWEDAPSVILGAASYEALLHDPAAQALQQAAATLRTLVFVGAGAGTGDPNLGALLRWAADTFAAGEYRHYRLCLDGEVGGLAGGTIVPVAYGPSHAHLEGFLRSLAPARPAPPGGRPAWPAAAMPGVPGPRATFGREGETAQVVAAVLAPTPTVVLGGPGMGKTNLALAALHHPAVVARYGPRRFFARCE